MLPNSLRTSCTEAQERRAQRRRHSAPLGTASRGDGCYVRREAGQRRGPAERARLPRKLIGRRQDARLRLGSQAPPAAAGRGAVRRPPCSPGTVRPEPLGLRSACVVPPTLSDGLGTEAAAGPQVKRPRPSSRGAGSPEEGVSPLPVAELVLHRPVTPLQTVLLGPGRAFWLPPAPDTVVLRTGVSRAQQSQVALFGPAGSSGTGPAFRFGVLTPNPDSSLGWSLSSAGAGNFHAFRALQPFKESHRKPN